MNERDFHHLLYIQKYCRMVAESIARFGADFEIFASDIDYFNSVSMSIMQIGEHAKNLTVEFTDSTNELIPWHAVRGIRNMFAHEYITMDKTRIWATACKEIPNLLVFCKEEIEKSGVYPQKSVQEQKASIRERLRKKQTFDVTNSPE